MEFALSTDLKKSLPQAIEFNYPQLKAWIESSLEKYEGRAVTEDGIKDGKADRADLNRVKKALDDARLQTKREYLKPYEDFEAKVKELTGLIDKPIAAIDAQIKAFDEQQKQGKQNQIQAYFDARAGELAELLPFEKVFNPRWLNISFKMSDITKEIDAVILRVGGECRTIKGMGLECEAQMLDVYFRDLSLTAALAEKTRWEERKRQLAGLEKKQPEPAQNVSPVSEPVEEAAPPQAYNEVTKTIRVIFYNTTAAFRAEMRALTEKYDIDYGRIKE